MLNPSEFYVLPVRRPEEGHFQELMQAHHYLGAMPKISETLWYVALFRDQRAALLSFSAAALKCSPRDRWIGWGCRHPYARLKLVTNNSSFLILPEWHVPNLGSRILSLCQKRLVADWSAVFGHPVLRLETFVDPERFRGSVYRADNWLLVGQSQGFGRLRQGCSATAQSSKLVFVKPLGADVRALLTQPRLDFPYLAGESKIMLQAEQMRSVPSFLRALPTPAAAEAGATGSPPC